MENHTQNQMQNTIKTLLTEGKGILALDESIKSSEKRLSAVGLENTKENRHAFRDLFINTEGIGEYVSGYILHDETLWDFLPTLQCGVKNGAPLIGIKVDEGLKDFAENSNIEKISTGLETLDERLKKYKEAGAVFTKWRSEFVIDIEKGLPSEENIFANAKVLAEYSKKVQAHGMVPIVEPEVSMQGAHGMADCASATERVLTRLFEALKDSGVDLSSLLLKTNMVVPGKVSAEAGNVFAKGVASATIAVLKACVPVDVGGVVFLSGGQTPQEATIRLDAIAESEPLPWPIAFSFARAIQEPAMQAWQGQPENLPLARKELLHRLQLNSFADLGAYEESMEAHSPTVV